MKLISIFNQTRYLCLIALALVEILSGQTTFSQVKSTLEVNVSLITYSQNMECNSRVEFTVYFTDGTKNEFTMSIPARDFEDGERYTFPLKTLTYSKIISSIKMRGVHEDHESMLWSTCEQKGEETKTVYLSSLYPCPSGTITKILGKYDDGSKITYKVIPKLETITYSANGISRPTNDAVIIDTKKIKFTAPSGFPTSVYKWKYYTASAGWKDFPTSFQGKSEIEFCGNDLFPNFREIVAKKENVRVQIDYGCGQSNIIVLTPLLAAPEIVLAEGIKTSCGSVVNGKIKVRYSRPLYDGETLSFGLYNTASPDSYAYFFGWNNENLIKNPENNEVTLSGAPVGAYSVRILGYLGSDSTVVYTDDSPDYLFKNVIVEKGEDPVVIDNSNVIYRDIVCKGASDGGFSLKATGGSGKYYINVYPEEDYSTPIAVSELFSTVERGEINGLKAGTYSVKVIDDNGCESTNSIIAEINEPENALSLSVKKISPSSIDENNDEESNGYITVTAVPVTPDDGPYSFVWKLDDKDGETLYTITSDSPENTFDRLIAGKFYVSVTNRIGCVAETEIILPRTPNIIISIIQTGSIKCSGEATGRLEANVTGGCPPFHFQWYKIDELTDEKSPVGSDNAVLADITYGFYQLKVTDSIGSRTISATVEQMEENPINATFKTDYLNCFNSTDGFLEIDQISGGTPPYQYQWFNGSTNQRIEGLKAGKYALFISDAAGCAKTIYPIVSAPTQIEVKSDITNPSCYEMSDGKISLSITGGNTPYSIKWDDGSTLPTLENLKAGTYNVEITDAKNCETVSKSIAVNHAKLVSISLTEFHYASYPGVNDARFTVRISGGTQPYSITCLKDGVKTISPHSIVRQINGSVDVSFSGLAVGIYIVTVEDSKYQNDVAYRYCTSTFSITIDEAPPLAVKIKETNSIKCFGSSDGKLFADVSGGTAPFTFQWFRVENSNNIPIDAKNSEINLPSGVYCVQITDAYGYSAFSEPYRLSEPEKITITFVSDSVDCYGGENGALYATVTGGTGSYSYLWNTEETSSHISGKKAGQYTLSVIDENACTASSTGIIGEPDPFFPKYQIITETCSGSGDASISLEITGGVAPYRFLWSNGATESSISNLCSGEYSVTVYDNANCSFDTTFVIENVLPIKATIVESEMPKAYGYSDGELTVEITGGTIPYQISWKNSVGEPINSVNTDNISGKTVSNLMNISEGNYCLYIEDAHGCSDSAIYYLPQPPKLDVNITLEAIISCYGASDGKISSSCSGGVPFTEGLPYTYTWTNDGEIFDSFSTEISGLQAGSYSLKITDANGIEAISDKIVITEPEPLTIAFSTADISCSRDTDGWAEVTVSGGTKPYSIEWSTGAETSKIENVGKGKYFCIVKDANGCEITGIAEIVQSNGIIVTSQTYKPACNGGSDGQIIISLAQGEPPYSYFWEDGSRTLNRTGLSKGEYTFTVEDAFHCGYESIVFSVEDPEIPSIDLGEDRVLCNGQQALIKASGPEDAVSYKWFDQSGNIIFEGKEFSISDAGTYTVKAFTNDGCEAVGNITITRENKEIKSDFLIATKVPINDETYAINISNISADSVRWELPDDNEYEVLAQSEDALILVFHQYGEYIIGMKTYLGNCWETVYKSIQVMDKIDIDNYEDALEPEILSFNISPNPSRGAFTVHIEMKNDSPADLYILKTEDGSIMQKISLTGEKVYDKTISLPLSDGTYVLNLVTSKAKMAKKVIIY